MDLPASSALIVVPGLTGPFSSSHASVYEFLTTNAKARGFVKVVTAVLPGQADAAGNRTGSLAFSSSVAKVRQVLKEEMDSNERVRLCGISFGCGVAVSAVCGLSPAISLERLSLRLWGPIPLWQSWKAFWQGPMPEQLGRGTQFGDHRQFYTDLEPLETTLPGIRLATKVCMGMLDEYNPPAWLDYLRALCSSATGNATVDVVPPLAGCHHSVRPEKSPGFAEYLNFMLN